MTLQSAVPEQPPPLQPRKKEPWSAWAVSVTAVPGEKFAEQVLVQSIPAGRSLWVAFGGGDQGGGVFRPSPVDAPLAEELVKSGFSASPATEAPLLFRFRRS